MLLVTWLFFKTNESFHACFRPVTSFLLEAIPFLPFLSLFPPFRFSLPLPSIPSPPPFPSFPCPYPKIQLGGLGERCKLPSGSGRARPPNEFWVQLKVKISQITLIYWHVHNANKYYAPLSFGAGGGVPGSPWTPFGYGPVLRCTKNLQIKLNEISC